MARLKVLAIGDHVTKTGFSRVLEGILTNLPKEHYDISVLGVNYYGDPHHLPYRVYPAMNPMAARMGDMLGITRVPEIVNRERPDLIFILNDIWVINNYLETLKKTFEKGRPKIVLYFPVDGTDHSPEWYQHLDFVDRAVTYTQFGREVATKALHRFNFDVIPHGVDHGIFFKIDRPKQEIKKSLFPNDPRFYEDSFVVLNANRNQPRKQWWITLEAFKLFVEGKPENVRLYAHAGMQDADIDIAKYAIRLGIDNHVTISSTKSGPQQLPESRLNVIYNSCEVGLNTSLGEGWGLPQFEHGATGAPQVVPEHSANIELYKDNGGLLVPITMPMVNTGIMTKGGLVRPEDVAERLQWLYSDKGLYDSLSYKIQARCTAQEFTWKNVAMQWHNLFKEVVNDN